MAGRTEDTRLAAWWKLVAAHALLMRRVGCDLAAATEKVSGRFFLRLLRSSLWPERACQTKLAGRAPDPGLASIGLTALHAMPQ